MNLKPIGDRIVVEPIEEDSTTKAGILVPDTAKEKSQKGKVLAVGSGKIVGDKVMPLEIKVGDTVLFKGSWPEEYKDGDNKYLILKEEDVLAILEGEK